MKKTILNVIKLITVTIILSGCSAKLITASPNSVTYQYDPASSAGLVDAGEKAQVHCSKYNKMPELVNNSGTTFGFSSVTFHCK